MHSMDGMSLNKTRQIEKSFSLFNSKLRIVRIVEEKTLIRKEEPQPPTFRSLGPLQLIWI